MAKRSVTFYIDNNVYIDNNALLAIRKNSAKLISIQAMAGLIWHRIRELNITPMFERVPSKRNIAELPTRRAQVKYKSQIKYHFCNSIDRRNNIERTIERITNGVPIEPHSLRIKRTLLLPSNRNRVSVANTS